MADHFYYIVAIFAKSYQISELLVRTREIIVASKELLGRTCTKHVLWAEEL
jgi:hypothetical protein